MEPRRHRPRVRRQRSANASGGVPSSGVVQCAGHISGHVATHCMELKNNKTKTQAQACSTTSNCASHGCSPCTTVHVLA